jgi:hypothetical protein
LPGVVDQYRDADDQQHQHLESEEEAGPPRRQVYAADHEEQGSGHDGQGEGGPRDMRVQVALHDDGGEAAGDGDHRGHRDDVADPGDERGGDGAVRPERHAHEGDQ